MEMVFHTVLGMSLTACIAISIVCLARYALKKAPKALSYVLWAVVLFRLLCPLSLPSPISLIPQQVSLAASRWSDTVTLNSHFEIRDIPGNTDSPAPEGKPSEDIVMEAEPSKPALSLPCRIWLAGVAAMGAYILIAGLHIRRKTATAIPVGKQIFLADGIRSPFVLGIFRPRIYLPAGLTENEQAYILLHEKQHIARLDYVVKMLAFLALSIHWFNPLVWLAAHMSRTDSELACDERVSRNLTAEGRNAYAGVLVLAAARRDLPGVAVLSTGMSMTGKKLKHRVAGILANRRMHKGLALAFVLLSSMALVGAFATSEIAPKWEPDLHSHQIISAQTEVKAFDLKDEQSWIDFAKTVWQNPYLKAKDLDSLQWSASTVRDTSHTEVDHTEVLGCNADGEIMLASAFLEDGTLIYISNFAEMSTQYMVVDTPKYEGYPTRWEPVRDFGLEAIESLRPGYTAKYTNLSEPSEGKADGGRMSLFFGQHTDYNYISTFRVQVEPESRLIYFVDLEYMSHNDTDRLAPGNG